MGNHRLETYKMNSRLFILKFILTKDFYKYIGLYSVFDTTIKSFLEAFLQP